MKPLSAFYDYLLPDVRGLDEALALVELRKSIIRFLEETKLWVKDLDPVTSIANEGTYDLEAPLGKHRVVQIKRAWFDEAQLLPRTSDQLDELYGHWPTEVGTPKYLLSDDLTVLTLVPKPSASNMLITARAAIVPNYDATQVEDVIFNTYLRDIIHGAKATLFSMKDKPWTDGARADYHSGLFESAIGSRSIQADKGFHRAPLRSKPQFR